MGSALIDETPLILLPSLARLVGVNEAIVTQQLHFLLSIPKNGRMHDGHRWIFNTYEEWQRDYFPFWSIKTIMRIFVELEKMQVVASCQPEGRNSRRKYYRLNRGMIPKLTKENAPELPEGDNLGLSSPEEDNLGVSRKVTTCPLPSGQNGSFLNAETSSENISLSAQKQMVRKKITPSIPSEKEAIDYGTGKRQMTEDQALEFYDYYQARGWESRGTPIRDWKALMRTWRAPDEKTSRPTPKLMGPIRLNL